MTEYVKSQGLPDFQERVNELEQEGWERKGEASVTQIGAATCFFQAMEKKKYVAFCGRKKV